MLVYLVWVEITFEFENYNYISYQLINLDNFDYCLLDLDIDYSEIRTCVSKQRTSQGSLFNGCVFVIDIIYAKDKFLNDYVRGNSSKVRSTKVLYE